LPFGAVRRANASQLGMVSWYAAGFVRRRQWVAVVPWLSLKAPAITARCTRSRNPGLAAARRGAPGVVVVVEICFDTMSSADNDALRTCGEHECLEDPKSLCMVLVPKSDQKATSQAVLEVTM